MGGRGDGCGGLVVRAEGGRGEREREREGEGERERESVCVCVCVCVYERQPAMILDSIDDNCCIMHAISLRAAVNHRKSLLLSFSS